MTPYQSLSAISQRPSSVPTASRDATQRNHVPMIALLSAIGATRSDAPIAPMRRTKLGSHVI